MMPAIKAAEFDILGIDNSPGQQSGAVFEIH
jgi:hypothetical protein